MRTETEDIDMVGIAGSEKYSTLACPPDVDYVYKK
jgi:hypothetical protein